MGHQFAAIVLCGLALLLSGCAQSAAGGTSGTDSSGDTGGLAAFAGAPSPTTVQPRPTTSGEKSEVEAGYRAYWEGLRETAEAGDPSSKTMFAVAQPELALKATKATSVLFSLGLHMIGPISVRVRSITVNGGTAQVTACVDTMQWVSVALKQPSPNANSQGHPTGLDRGDLVRRPSGEWRLTRHSAEPGGC